MASVEVVMPSVGDPDEGPRPLDPLPESPSPQQQQQAASPQDSAAFQFRARNAGASADDTAITEGVLSELRAHPQFVEGASGPRPLPAPGDGSAKLSKQGSKLVSREASARYPQYEEGVGNSQDDPLHQSNPLSRRDSARQSVDSQGQQQGDDLEAPKFQVAPLKWAVPDFTLTPPDSRGGHSLTAANGKLYVIGGHIYRGNNTFKYYNDLYIFDTETHEWSHSTKVLGNQLPAARYWHTANLVGENMIVLFGGRGAKAACYNDVYILTLDNLRWQRGNPQGNPPPARYAHTATVVDEKLYIFGGTDGVRQFNDVYILSNIGTHDMVWEVASATGKIPIGRHGHSAALYGRQLVTFGGYTDSGRGTLEYLNDVHVFGVDNNNWARPQLFGRPPPARYFHSFVCIGDLLFLCGGWGIFKRCICNVPLKGDPVRHNKGCILADNKILYASIVRPSAVLDNVVNNHNDQHTPQAPSRKSKEPTTSQFLQNLQSSKQEKVKIEPCPVCGAVPRSQKDEVRHAPGCKIGEIVEANRAKEGDVGFRTLWILDTYAMRWTSIRVDGVNAPCARYGHASAVMGAKLFIHGGWDGVTAMNDLRVLDISSLVAQTNPEAIEGAGEAAGAEEEIDAF